MTLRTIELLLIIVAPMLTALALFIFPRRLRPAARWLAGGAAALSLATMFSLIPALQRGEIPAIALTWIPAAGIEFDLHIDWLTLPFAITEGVVTLLAVIYAWGSETDDARGHAAHASYFYALLLLFAVGMAGTTLADDMVLFYTFWELMLLASCALILVWGHSIAGGTPLRNVALKYFIFTHLGSLLVLVALVILYDATGTDRFSVLRNGVALTPNTATAVIALFIVGFCVKMAIFPLHIWLPDAHTVAPMPVTIMLAAAMLSMGTYGILRFPMSIFSLAQVQPFAVPMMVMGILSEIYGALMALAERDIKRIIAYSSVSQMGYILYGMGTLTYNGLAGATLHVIYHAIVKALLFMVVGLVIHVTGKRRVDELGGLAHRMPLVTACGAVGVMSIIGVPPLGIFDSEWMIFSGGFQTPYTTLSVVTLFGSLLTVAYALWFGSRIFLGSDPVKITPSSQAPVSDHAPAKLPLAMIAPAVLLSVLAVIEGVFPAPLFDWVAHELPLLLGGHW
ncbi:MAG: NADH-quinone oxidoreductase subunit M [Anaerolineae bacterium]|nr:NADH-quinone oxidoreductase subunit M [Anaerolineae bacterium]